MPIFKGSRYEYVPVYQHYNGPDASDYKKNIPQTMIPTIRRRPLDNFDFSQAITHVYQNGDRIDLLAYKYYGDPSMWWVILDANPQYLHPLEIPSGARLIIPPMNYMGGDI
jgi:phage tail protein X